MNLRSATIGCGPLQKKIEAITGIKKYAGETRPELFKPPLILTDDSERLRQEKKKAAERRRIREEAKALASLEKLNKEELDRQRSNQILEPIGFIRACVCEHFNVSKIDILSQRRDKKVIRPRQIAMYLCATQTGASLPLIGKMFGKRDHTTVLHARDKIAGLLVNGDPETVIAVGALQAKIQGSLGEPE